MLDNIGMPYSGINLSLSEGALISSADGQILHLAEGGPRARPPSYVRKLRTQADRRATPRRRSSSCAPDISTQVLNFGLPAPIDVQVVGAPGNDEQEAYELAQQLAAPGRGHSGRRRRAPGAGAARARSSASTSTAPWPASSASASATWPATCSSRCRRAGRSRRASGSTRSAAFSTWSPCRRRSTSIDSLDALAADAAFDAAAARRSSCRTWRRSAAATGPANITHYNVARTFDVHANVDGTDLGVGRRRQLKQLVAETKPKLPRGASAHPQGPGREHGVARSAASATACSSRCCSSTC